jgi:hypothetical protein
MDYIVAEKMRTTGARRRYGEHVKYQVSVTGVFDIGWARQSETSSRQMFDLSAHSDPLVLARAPFKMSGIYHLVKLSAQPTSQVCMLCGGRCARAGFACGDCHAAVVSLFLQYAETRLLVAHIGLPTELCGIIADLFVGLMGRVRRYGGCVRAEN